MRINIYCPEQSRRTLRLAKKVREALSEYLQTVCPVTVTVKVCTSEAPEVAGLSICFAGVDVCKIKEKNPNGCFAYYGAGHSLPGHDDERVQWFSPNQMTELQEFARAVLEVAEIKNSANLIAHVFRTEHPTLHSARVIRLMNALSFPRNVSYCMEHITAVYPGEWDAILSKPMYTITPQSVTMVRWVGEVDAFYHDCVNFFRGLGIVVNELPPAEVHNYMVAVVVVTEGMKPATVQMLTKPEISENTIFVLPSPTPAQLEHFGKCKRLVIGPNFNDLKTVIGIVANAICIARTTIKRENLDFTPDEFAAFSEEIKQHFKELAKPVKFFTAEHDPRLRAIAPNPHALPVPCTADKLWPAVSAGSA